MKYKTTDGESEYYFSGIGTMELNSLKLYLKYIWEDKIEDNPYLLGLWIVILATLIVMAVMFFISLILNPFFALSCKEVGKSMDLPSKYSYWSGCFLQYKGFWIPKDQIIGVLFK